MTALRLIYAMLLIIAAAVFVANFEGLSLTLGADTLWLRAFAAFIGFAVGFAVLTFWHLAFHIIPFLTSTGLRIAGWSVVLIGALAILLFSAWWTAAALGGHAAREAGRQAVVTLAEGRLAEALQDAGAFQGLLPRIDSLAGELRALQQCELQTGCVTGGGGSGGVASFLGQLAGTAGGIADAGRAATASLQQHGAATTGAIAAMRRALDQPGDVLSAELDGFNTALAAIAGVGAGRQLQQSLGGFTEGLVVPVSVRSPRQMEAVERIIAGLRQKTAGIAQAAEALVAAPIEPVALPRQNAMQAVIANWQAILPAVATAICLDLVPLILLLLRTIAVAADRHRPEEAVLNWSVRDLWHAHRMLRRRLEDDGAPLTDPRPR